MSTVTHKNKFAAILANKDGSALANRIEVISNQARLAQETLVNNLAMKKLEKEGEITSLLDVGPDTSIDLRPGKNFNAAQVMTSIHQKKVELLQIELELGVAKETFEALFGTPVVDQLPDAPAAGAAQ